ncbi:branched-chain alpha-ketoacid dehydrogenase [Gymnopilus junonius]|uniref:Protein-serine/threonine kinase n=1 Tax=Gymnopilus junonius TaxID=109634 RepID=A0A9P5P3Z0_GYMJU|nr:branched-chain alpha-ketoacid dehydrogenase [Gymnopilus junonius]
MQKDVHPSARQESTALHFYQNRQLELYASKEAKRLTLRQLVYFGRHINQERLIKSANYVRTELPVRIAHRLRDLQALPYVVVTQEGVAKVYELYWSAFEKFRRYPPIITLAENEAFCEFVNTLLNEHATVIPNLSLGLSLSSPHLPPDTLDSFMRRMLVSRISRRVLAEHHIALSESYSGRNQESNEEPHVGIIYTGLSIKQIVEHCDKLLRGTPVWPNDLPADALPEIKIDGHLETSFAYIREHLEYDFLHTFISFMLNKISRYIIFELLKNSLRATYIKYQNEASRRPIQVTIVNGENDVMIRISDQGGGLRSARNQVSKPSDLFSFSHVRNSTRLEDSRLGALRSVSLSEHGLRATVDEQIGSWQKGRTQIPTPATAVVEQILQPTIGIGLPMSYIYATYFGGTLELVSLDGWGTDVYLRLPKLGTNLEGIEV